jgi:hypothetical protein
MTEQRFTVDNSTDPLLLETLAEQAYVILDVTKLNLGRLPAHVKAALQTDATIFSAPQLQTSGAIYANSAKSFSAPQLQTSRNIWAPNATSFIAPHLQTTRDIYVPKASTQPTIRQRIRTALSL